MMDFHIILDISNTVTVRKLYLNFISSITKTKPILNLGSQIKSLALIKVI